MTFEPRWDVAGWMTRTVNLLRPARLFITERDQGDGGYRRIRIDRAVCLRLEPRGVVRARRTSTERCNSLGISRLSDRALSCGSRPAKRTERVAESDRRRRLGYVFSDA